MREAREGHRDSVHQGPAALGCSRGGNTGRGGHARTPGAESSRGRPRGAVGPARKELLEVLTRHAPERVCLRAAESGQNVAASLQRAEMDGVVQATISERGIPVWRLYDATVRSAFSAKIGRA